MPTFLDLTAAQPLDVLLSTQKGVTSAVIRAGQTISRRKRARYSHAALLLSNSVLVEAIGKGGTILCNLASSKGDLGGSSNDRSMHLHCRLVDGEVRIYALLPNKTAATLVRHKSQEDMPTANYWRRLDDLLVARSQVLGLLVDVYLASYSIPARLIGSVADLPTPIQSFLERGFKADRAKKRRTGPFCSELVGLLLSEVYPDTTDHVRKAPIDFIDDQGDYVVVESAVVEGQVDDLPGTAYPTWLATDLVNLLWSARIEGQDLARKVVEVLSLLPPVVAHTSDGSQERLQMWEQLYEEKLREQRTNWVQEIESELTNHFDACWRWLRASNECYRVCPGGDDWLRARRIKHAARYVVGVRLGGGVLTRDPTVRCADAVRCTVYGHELEDMRTARLNATTSSATE